MNKRYDHFPCVVTLAGTDPSGGAGIQADIKTLSATGSYAASIITVLVAQNTRGVQSIYPIPPEFVMQQIDAVFNDLEVSAVKIGMVYNRDIMEIILAAFKQYNLKNIVLDPIMKAKDNSLLLQPSEFEFFTNKLFPEAYIITPNLIEAEYILSKKIISLFDMEEAAKKIANQYHTNVLVKGGHFDGDGSKASDVLFLINENKIKWFHSKRINTINTHGTGCTFSSAIASYLAQNYTLVDSINLAKTYLFKTIHAGSKIRIGHGNGPVDQFYFLRNN